MIPPSDQPQLVKSLERAQGAQRRRWSATVIGLLVLAVVSSLSWLGWIAATGWTRLQASRCLEQHSVSASLDWLYWSSWLSPNDGRNDLLRASAYRHLQRDEHDYFEAVEMARRKGVAAIAIEREIRLHEIESGEVGDRADHELVELIGAGESPHEVCKAFVFGHLHRQDSESARRVLDAWAADFPGEPHVAFVWGVYWRSVGDMIQAEKELRAAVAGQKQHELAAIALARLFEEQQSADDAVAQWIDAAKRFPASDTVHMGLAQMLRKLGLAAEARELLAPRVAHPIASCDLLLEASHVEFELGNYGEACRFLSKAKLEQVTQFRQILAHSTALAVDGKSSHANELFIRVRAAATAFALCGVEPHAEWLFEQMDGIYSQLQHREHLRLRLDQNAGDQEASRELERLIARLSKSEFGKPEESAKTAVRSQSSAGRELYRKHCAVCHGTEGNGNGRAARHLDPRPRDLCREPFRLVSSRNALPSEQDIVAVIRNGMPGTSMPAFSELTSLQRQLLAEEVLRFRNNAIRARLIEVNPGIADDDLANLVSLHTAPDSPEPIPQFDRTDSSSINRGKEAFVNLGCIHCHDEKNGAEASLLFDATGRPTPARNLVHDPFKGGREPESIYLRLRLGMPGTAHPACVNVPEHQLIDLVQYCLSVAQQPAKSSTNYQRSLRSILLPRSEHSR